MADPLATDSKPLVLIVEDEPINARLAQRALERHGVEVRLASAGREAHAMMQETRFAGVLMDLGLPDVRGSVVVRHLRQTEHSAGVSRTPVFAMTAEDIDAQDLADGGFDGRVSKPIAEAEVTAFLARVKGEASAAAAAVPAPRLRVLDLEGLRERVCHDDALIRELLEDFIQCAPEMLAAVEDACAGERRTDLKSRTHRLKGALLAIGAERAAASAKKLEYGALEEAVPTLASMLDALRADLVEVRAAAAAR